ncbi:hypothetical protein HK101_004674 [Irineochytrium annulatum]|nr:hypothetical protein HK101_004674 [Irineochytrium annulatum]
MLIEKRKLREEERKGNEVQLEMMRLLAQTPTSATPHQQLPINGITGHAGVFGSQPFEPFTTNAGGSPSLDALLAGGMSGGVSAVNGTGAFRFDPMRGLGDVAFPSSSSLLESDAVFASLQAGAGASNSFDFSLMDGGDSPMQMLLTPERGYHVVDDFKDLGGGVEVGGSLESLNGRLEEGMVLDGNAVENYAAVQASVTSSPDPDIASNPSPSLCLPQPAPSASRIKKRVPTSKPGTRFPSSAVSSTHKPSKKTALAFDSSSTPHPAKPLIPLLPPLLLVPEGASGAAAHARRKSSMPELHGKRVFVPGDVFAHAAARASNRRRTVEEPCVCASGGACGGRTLGTLHLRGTVKALEVRCVADIRCAACVGEEASSAGGGGGRKGKKRGRETAARVECEVCKKGIGFGGVRRALESEINGGAGEMGEDVDEEESNGKELGIEVEVVCVNCAEKYLFCSECGGGGKSRTGKWRPRAMFESSRKTCSLPHIRIGSALVQHRVLEVPTELTADVMRGVQEVFFDCLLSLYAIPAVLEHHPTLTTYESVKGEVEGLWRGSVQDAIETDASFLGGKKMYLIVAWIEKRHRNKGKKPKNAEREQMPWLQRLALEGIVAPRKLKGSSSSSNTASAGEGDEGDGQDPDRCYTAFSVYEWDRARGALFTLQMSPRSIFIPTMESYAELIRRGVERVRADVRRDGAPALEHVWCWTRREEHTRLKVVPERLGFVRREEYLRMHPEVDRTTFERDGFGPLAEEGCVVWVTSVKDFLKGKYGGEGDGMKTDEG